MRRIRQHGRHEKRRPRLCRADCAVLRRPLYHLWHERSVHAGLARLVWSHRRRNQRGHGSAPLSSCLRNAGGSCGRRSRRRASHLSDRARVARPCVRPGARADAVVLADTLVRRPVDGLLFDARSANRDVSRPRDAVAWARLRPHAAMGLAFLRCSELCRWDRHHAIWRRCGRVAGGGRLRRHGDRRSGTAEAGKERTSDGRRGTDLEGSGASGTPRAKRVPTLLDCSRARAGGTRHVSDVRNIALAEAGDFGDVERRVWAIGVAAEVLLFSISGRVVEKFGAVRLIAIGAAVSIVRWVALAMEPSVAVLVPLQVLHGVTYGASHIGAIHFIHHAIPRDKSGSAQALYATVASGIAMGCATLIAGWVYADAGSLVSCDGGDRGGFTDGGAAPRQDLERRPAHCCAGQLSAVVIPKARDLEGRCNLP